MKIFGFRILSCFVAILYAGEVSDLFGHGNAHEQIILLSNAIAEDGKNAELFLQRADLYRAHQYPEPALKDYNQALEIEPKLIQAHLGLGALQLGLGEYKAALEHLDTFLKVAPKDVQGLIFRARTNYGLGKYAESVKDYDRAIELASAPLPEWFLEQAQAVVELHWADGSEEDLQRAYGNAALKVRKGIELLGSAVTLEMAALEYERLGKDFDQALARVDRLLSQARRKESWLLRKGDLLKEAGRPAEATEAYQSALASISELSESRQMLKSVVSMKSYADEQISELKNLSK
jgi:tetratricopeptide (TPR) repeat protein